MKPLEDNIMKKLLAVIMSVVLIWMKSRLGLKPEEYKKEDIEFDIS